MKQLLYLLAFSLSAAVVCLVSTNQLFFQDAPSILTLSAQAAEPEVDPEQAQSDQVEQFLASYPYAPKATPKPLPEQQDKTSKVVSIPTSISNEKVQTASLPFAYVEEENPIRQVQALTAATASGNPDYGFGPAHQPETGFASSGAARRVVGSTPSAQNPLDQWSDPTGSTPVNLSTPAPVPYAPQTSVPVNPMVNAIPPRAAQPAPQQPIPVPIYTAPVSAPANVAPMNPAPMNAAPMNVAPMNPAPMNSAPIAPPMNTAPAPTSPPVTAPAVTAGEADPFMLALGGLVPVPVQNQPVAPAATPMQMPIAAPQTTPQTTPQVPFTQTQVQNQPIPPRQPEPTPLVQPAPPVQQAKLPAIPETIKKAPEMDPAAPKATSLYFTDDENGLNEEILRPEELSQLISSERQARAPISQFQINPSIVAEEVPCHGTETVARVGTQVILMCDLLPTLRREALRLLNVQIKKLSEAEQAKVPQEEKDQFIESWIEEAYPMFLRDQIMAALAYNDYALCTPREQIEGVEKQLADEFDLVDVPEMIKQYEVKDIGELKEYLKKELGSSLERERMLQIRGKISHQWSLNAIKTAEGECTHDEMMEYYTKNKTEFEKPARSKWRELVVSFSNHPNEKAAWDKIVWMGNQVIAGAPFEEIAKLNSDGFTSSKGGQWDWTLKGSLTSEELENAIFNQPVGQLSPIIKLEKALYIVQVTQREEFTVVPFIEAQATIRNKIKQLRRQRYYNEYYEELQRKFPVIVLREKINFNTTLKTGQGAKGIFLN